MAANRMLITGGVGFIGVNAAARFLRDGWTVTVLDNFSRRGVELNNAFLDKEFPSAVRVVRGDVRTDMALLQQFCEEHDVVLHLAAQVAVTTSVVNPREDFDINAYGTFNVLEAIRVSKRRPILLYASTNKVYGGLEHVAVTEEENRYSFTDGRPGVSEQEQLDFHSPYGCSKGAADQYVRDYARLYGLKTVVFRQSCIYGPHQFGVEDQGWVAWFMIAGMLNRPVHIYGNGKQVRDLLYVDDLVDCYARAIAQIETTSGRVYNVGGGKRNTLSLREFIAFLDRELGIKLSYDFAAERPGDQPLFISDNGKVEQDIGWTPATGVADGIRKLHAWLQENKAQVEGFYR